MYTLKSTYYKKTFNTLNELLDDIIMYGVDPNQEILKNGKSIGEAIEYISF